MCVKNDSSQLIQLLPKIDLHLLDFGFTPYPKLSTVHCVYVCIISDILQLVATVFYFFAEAKIDIYNKLSISQKFLL